MKKQKRKPSERRRFELWLRRDWGTDPAHLREIRTEHGYTSNNIDYMWMAWQARAAANGSGGKS